MSKIHVNVTSNWNNVKNVHVNVSNTWKSCIQAYVNIGTWMPIWEYKWTIGAWSSCSASCGGGGTN